jgi:hypothetical protein
MRVNDKVTIQDVTPSEIIEKSPFKVIWVKDKVATQNVTPYDTSILSLSDNSDTIPTYNIDSTSSYSHAFFETSDSPSLSSPLINDSSSLSSTPPSHFRDARMSNILLKPITPEDKLRIFITPMVAGRLIRLLVDTGSDISTLNPKLVESLNLLILPSSGGSLIFGDGSSLARGQQVSEDFTFQGYDLLQTFDILDSSSSSYDGICGLDLFKKLQAYVIFPHNIPLMHPSELRILLPPITNESIEARQIKINLKELLDLNSNISSHTPCNHPALPVTLPTKDSTSPTYSKARRMSPQNEILMVTWVNNLKAQGIVTELPLSMHDSPYNHHVFPVKQRDPITGIVLPDAEPRYVMDPSPLNKILIMDRTHIPNIHLLREKLMPFTFFAKLDLKKAFNQFPLHPSDQFKTAFTVAGVRYMFTRLQFGFANGSAVFQKIMSDIFIYDSNIMVYVDDIIIGAHTVEELEEHLKQAIITLNKFNLRLNHEKSSFCTTELDILGAKISHNKASLTNEQAALASSLPYPSSHKQLWSLLGLVGYFRPFIPNLATLIIQLESLLHTTKGTSPKDFKKISSDEIYHNAFQELKKAIAGAAVLNATDPLLPLYITTDASDHAIGATLFQPKPESPPLPSPDNIIGIFSKKLSGAQLNYDPCKRELLAVVSAVKHFDYLLLGNEFTILSDSQALTWANSPQNKATNQWHEFLLGYNYKIAHIPGTENFLADFISRVNTITRSSTGHLLPSPLRALNETKSSSLSSKSSSTTPTPSTLTMIVAPDIVSPLSSSTIPSTTPTPPSGPIRQDSLSPDEITITNDQAVFTSSLHFPTTNKLLWSFLGFVGYLEPLIPELASIIYPLRDLLRLTKTSSPEQFQAKSSDKKYFKAFEDVKRAIAGASPVPQESASPDTTAGASPIPQESSSPDTITGASPVPQESSSPDTSTESLFPSSKGFIYTPYSIANLLHLEHQNSGHFGADAMYLSLTTKGFYWPTMRRNMLAFVKSCRICLTHNPIRRQFNELQAATAEKTWEKIQVDLCTAFDSSSTAKYLLVVIDIFSDYSFAFPIINKSALEVGNKLKDLFLLVGNPTHITSDGGNEFDNSFFEETMVALKVNHHISIPYSFRGHGRVESKIKTIYAVIHKQLEGNNTAWPSLIAKSMHQINNKVNNTTLLSPFNIFFNRTPISPTLNIPLPNTPWLNLLGTTTKLILPQIAIVQSSHQANAKANYKKKHIKASFALYDIVFIKTLLRSRKSQPVTLGPFVIIELMANNSVRLTQGTIEYHRLVPIHELKKAGPLFIIPPGETRRALKILDHVGLDNAPSVYKILWADKSSGWIPAENIANPSLINKYFSSKLFTSKSSNIITPSTQHT